MKNSLVIPSIVATNGEGGGSDINLDRIIIKSDTIPTASEENYKRIYIYTGETNETYTHDYMYECKGSVEAQSVTLDFYPGKIAFDYEYATHPYKTFTSDAEALSDFVATVLKIANYADIATMRFVVVESTIIDHEHHEMWKVFCEDKDGNTLLSDYSITAGDMEAYGFRFAYPPADYSESEPIETTLTWVTTLSDLHWERIDVQPSSSGGNAEWGVITGNLADQTDLKNALDAKQDVLTATNHIKIENNVIGQDGADLSNVTSGDNISVKENVEGFGINADTWAYYKLDDNLVDSSLTKNTELHYLNYDETTDQDIEVVPTYTNGIFGNGIEIDASKWPTFVLNNKTLLTDNTISIDFWAKTPILSTNQQIVFFIYFKNDYSSYITLRYQNYNDMYRVLLLYVGNTNLGYQIVSGQGDTYVADDKWTHFYIQINNLNSNVQTYKIGAISPEVTDTPITFELSGTQQTNLNVSSGIDIIILGFSNNTIFDELHIQKGAFGNWYEMSSQYTQEVPNGTYTIDAVGLITAQDLTNRLSTYVTTNTVQQISGQKVFANVQTARLNAQNVSIAGINEPVSLTKYSNNSGIIVNDYNAALINNQQIVKSTIQTSYDSANNTGTISILAGPDAQHQAGIEITGDANGKANLTLTNPDIAANDSSNKVPTTEWVKENTYNSTNLTAGSNMTLEVIPPAGGIDEHTLVLFDFENQDFTNTGNGPLTMIHTPSDAQVFSSEYKKFGNYGFDGTYGYFSYVPTSDGSGFAGDFTIDGWFRAAYGENQTTLFGLGAYVGSTLYQDYSPNVQYRNNYMEMMLGFTTQGTIVTDFDMSSTAHHVALTCKWSDRLIKIFIDGIEKYSYTFNANVTSFKFFFNANPSDYPDTQYAMAVDEYRFSNIVRYNGNFTPPIEAYISGGTSTTVINFDPTSITGYASSGTYVLKLVDGVLTWVAE